MCEVNTQFSVSATGTGQTLLLYTRQVGMPVHPGCQECMLYASCTELGVACGGNPTYKSIKEQQMAVVGIRWYWPYLARSTMFLPLAVVGFSLLPTHHFKGTLHLNFHRILWHQSDPILYACDIAFVTREVGN